MKHIKENELVIKNGEISFAGALTVGFIILKLMKVINWSWWWVLSPLWISAGLGVIICIVLIIFVLVAELIDRKREK